MMVSWSSAFVQLNNLKKSHTQCHCEGDSSLRSEQAPQSLQPNSSLRGGPCRTRQDEAISSFEGDCFAEPVPGIVPGLAMTVTDRVFFTNAFWVKHYNAHRSNEQDH